jgi:hypothetical protein
MSSEDVVRAGLVSRTTRIEERQGGSGVVLRPERPGERRERRVKFSEKELDSQEYRKRIIARDQAERRKVKEDIQRAPDQQEQSKRNGRR